MHFNIVYLVQRNNQKHCQHSYRLMITIITIINVIISIITDYELIVLFRCEDFETDAKFSLTRTSINLIHSIYLYFSTNTSIRILQCVRLNTYTSIIILQYMRFSTYTSKPILQYMHPNTYTSITIPQYIQGVSRLADITAGGDFLSLCDQKRSYKHVSDFGRLRSYGHFLIPVHALV